MSVVNCKVKYIRPIYHNLKEWIEDENNILLPFVNSSSDFSLLQVWHFNIFFYLFYLLNLLNLLNKKMV